MGWSAARKLRQAVDNLARILAVELTASARALEIRLNTGSGPLAPATAAALAGARAAGVVGPGTDRFLAPDLEAAEAYVATGGLVEAVETITGPLA
jgi:histidine ammonia-lyase